MYTKIVIWNARPSLINVTCEHKKNGIKKLNYTALLETLLAKFLWTMPEGPMWVNYYVT